jgi:hypothetical protein
MLSTEANPVASVKLVSAIIIAKAILFISSFLNSIQVFKLCINYQEQYSNLFGTIFQGRDRPRSCPPSIASMANCSGFSEIDQ